MNSNRTVEQGAGVGPIVEGESLREYLRRIHQEREAPPEDSSTAPDPMDPGAADFYPNPLPDPAARLLEKNADAFAKQREYGRHYPPRPWASWSEDTRARMNREMRLIGKFRQARGDSEWHFDPAAPWRQPILSEQMLCDWIEYRWNASQSLRHITVAVLRYHYARYERPRDYAMLEALIVRHPSRIADGRLGGVAA